MKKIAFAFLTLSFSNLYGTTTFEIISDFWAEGLANKANDLCFVNGYYYLAGDAGNGILLQAYDLEGNLRGSLYIARGDSAHSVAIDEFFGGLAVLGDFRTGNSESLLVVKITEYPMAEIDSKAFGADSGFQTLRASDLETVDSGVFGKGIFIAGIADDFTYLNPVLIRLDTLLDEQWRMYYRYPEQVKINALCQNINLEIIALAGGISIDTMFPDAFLMITDGQGSLLRTEVFGEAGVFEESRGVSPNSHGFVVSAVNQRNNSQASDAWIFDYDYSSHTVTWQNFFSFDTSRWNVPGRNAVMQDGSSVTCGYSGYELNALDAAFCIKLNSAGDLQWMRYYHDSAYSKGTVSLCLADSGFALAGVAKDSQWHTGEPDFYLLKTDIEGMLHQEWSKTYGFPYTDETAKTLCFTENNGYLLGGSHVDEDNGADVYLIKLSPWGMVAWENIYVFPETDEYLYDAVYFEPMDKYLFIGESFDSLGFNRTFMFYIEPDGSLMQASFGDTGTSSYGCAVYDTERLKGFVLTSATRSTAADDVIRIEVTKFDHMGNIMWRMIYDLPGDQIPFSISPMYAGRTLNGFVLTGATRSTTKDSVNYAFCARLNSDNGQMQGFDTLCSGEGFSCASYMNGSYVTGYTDSGGSGKDIFLASVFNPSQWFTVLNLEGDQIGYDLLFLGDTVAVCGYSSGSIHSGSDDENVFIAKFDRGTGQYLGSAEYIEPGDQICYSCVLSSDGCIATVGYTDNTAYSDRDFLFIKKYPCYLPYIGVEEQPGGDLTGSSELSIADLTAPAFVESRARIGFTVRFDCRVELRIFDSSGRIVKILARDVFSMGRYEYVWDCRDTSHKELPSGIYLVNLKTDTMSFSRKLVLVR